MPNPANEQIFTIETGTPSEKIARAAGYYPKELFKKHPELLTGETIHLHETAIAVDFPKYSTLMCSDFAALGVEMLNEFDQALAEKVTQNPKMTMLACSGDELLISSSTQNQLENITFAIEAQQAFMELLEIPKYQAIKTFFEAHTEEAEIPFIHFGIETPAENGHEDLAIKLADFVNASGETDRVELMVMCGVLNCKKTAKAFITLNSDAVFSEGHPTNTEEVLQDAGFTVKQLEDAQKEQIGIIERKKNYYSIKIPPNLDVHQALEMVQDTLPKELNPIQPFRPIQATEANADKILNMAPQYQRATGSLTPEHVISKEFQHEGEAAFYYINGINEIKQMLSQELDAKTASAITLDVASMVARVASAEMIQSGWHIKDCEFDADDNLNLVFLNNVYEPHTFTPQQLKALENSAQAITHTQLKQSLAERIRDKYTDETRNINIETLLNNISFEPRIGFAKCTADNNVTWILNETATTRQFYSGNERVGGSLISTAARLTHQAGKDITNGIVMFAEEAVRQGWIEENSPDIKTVRLKGFNEPARIYIREL